MKEKQELMTRVITAAVYVGIMILFILPGLWVPMIPLILMGTVTFLSAYEKGQALKLRMPPTRVLTLAILAVVLGLLALIGILKGTFLRGLASTVDPSVNTLIAPRIMGYYALFALFVLPLAGLFRMWKGGADLLPQTVAESAVILTSSLPLAASIALLYGIRFGWRWFVLAILSSWISDTFAYFAGRFLGRMRLAPALSPKKTWEGAIGGILGTLLLFVIFFPLLIGKPSGVPVSLSIPFALVAGLMMSISASLGDLRSSALKRWCGIKDFGSLLPGHGGISDRFDSIFTSLVAALLLGLLAGALF